MTFDPYSPSAQRERMRDYLRLRQDQEAAAQAARAQQEEYMSKRKRTPWGTVERPADVSGCEAELDRWRDDITEALGVCDAAAKRERSLAATSPVDEQRFTALQKRARGDR